MEKKLMQALVRDDFEAIGLKDYGVEINIDDLIFYREINESAVEHAACNKEEESHKRGD